MGESLSVLKEKFLSFVVTIKPLIIFLIMIGLLIIFWPSFFFTWIFFIIACIMLLGEVVLAIEGFDKGHLLVIFLFSFLVCLLLCYFGLFIFCLVVPVINFCLSVLSVRFFSFLDGQKDRIDASVAYAYSEGGLSAVKSLVDIQKNINQPVDFVPWGNALCMAAVKADLDALKYLIKNGADVNYVGRYPPTALHAAVENDKYAAAKLLIEHGANPSLTNNNYPQPLAWATSKKMVKLLIDHGADPSKGWFLAVTNRNLEVMDELLKHGVNIEMVNKNGNTAYEIAKSGNDNSVVEFLLKKYKEKKKLPNEVEEFPASFYENCGE
jgi:hypothetical protein